MSAAENTPAESTSRRSFLKAAGATVAAGAVAPAILGAADKAGTKNAVIGQGAHTYECLHGWGELPDSIKWGDTHGVTVDEAGFIYIKHRSDAPVPMDSIVVFDPAGKYVRSFGQEYHKGGHGIDIRKEGGEEFLYLSDIHNREVIKTNLKGEQVWKLCYPLEPGVYPMVNKFRPTNVCFNPDGGFYVADGYGSSYVHQYDKNARWLKTWGGPGKEAGKLLVPHGIWLDDRPGRTPSLVVADRTNARLQYFTLDGQHISFVDDSLFPCHFDIRGTELLVADAHARVTIRDIDNKVIVHLGYDPEWTKEVLEGPFKMRGQPERWQNGKFIHPHDACYDKDGNIFVVEWVPTGRVTFLRKV
ncbi:MAG: twin-arginine translocation signal domain-containing protein [Planctomycetaceae bacterium]